MEYKCKVQYLESTGTQYIDTGVKPDFANGDTIEVKFYKAAGDNNVCLFGSRQMPGVLNGFYVLGSTIVFCDNSSFDGTSFGQLGTITMTVDDAHVTFIDKTVDVSKRVTCAYNMYLFALNNGGYMFGNYSGMKLYYWKYYHNGVLAQHLVPVLDLNDVPCLYDTISEQLFYNKGTGQFLCGAVKGPSVPLIPSFIYPLGRITGAYASKLTYLQSTGTQYINTGIAPDFAGGDSIEISYFRADYTGSMPCVCGSRETTLRNGFHVLANNCAVYGSDNYKTYGVNEGFPVTQANCTIAVNDNYIVINGTLRISMPYRVTCSLAVTLFALRSGSSILVYYSGMKLYEWKYWHNGTLAQHLIPVLDRSGVPCLYDTVTRTLKYNAGTGTFNYA